VHEVVLRFGQRHCVAVVALGLPIAVGADDAQHRVGTAREFDGALDQVGRRGRPATDLEPTEPDRRHELHFECVLVARSQLDPGRRLRTRKTHERVAASGGVPVVDQLFAVEQ
jgi:hypothetical protein